MPKDYNPDNCSSGERDADTKVSQHKSGGYSPSNSKGRASGGTLLGYTSGILFLAGIIYAFFGGWFWAPIGIAAAFVLDAANSRSAQGFIAEAAERDPEFKAEMVVAGVILAE